jgi:hypothetical protein
VKNGKTGRAKDSDIEEKNYFIVDIDVRKTLIENECLILP